MPDFDVSKMPLPGGNPSAPASGTYGAKAAVDKLKQGMQSAMGQNAQPPAPGPKISATPGAAKPSVPSGPAGLPSALMAPTQRPEEAVGTLPAGPPVSPVAGAQSSNQARLAMLDALSQSPQVSAATREWASLAVRKLIESTKR